MTEVATYKGAQLAQNGFPLSNLIATDANGLEFSGGDDMPRMAEATITHYPVESDDILWNSVEVDLEMQNIGDATPVQLLLSLYGITCHGDINLIGERVFNSIPVTQTEETVTFDLLKSACEASLSVDSNQTDAGKIQLNLPFRTNYYESLTLNYGSYNGWKRYKTVPIKGNSSITTDIPIIITIPYTSNMNADFSDIIFVDWNGNSLDYGIFTKTDGSTATFIIELNSTPDSYVTEYISVWYKKSDTTSPAINLETLLDFYDHFNNSTIDPSWNVIAGNGTWSEGTTLTYYIATTTTLANSALWSGGSRYSSKFYRTISDFTGNWQATVKVNYNAMSKSNGKGMYIGLNTSNAIRIENVQDAAGNYHIWCTATIAGTEYTYASASFTNATVWLRIKYYNGTYYFQYSTTGLQGSFSTIYSTSSPGFTVTYIGLHGRNWLANGSYYYGLTASFSNFIVQKAMESEPSLGNLSSEIQGEYGGTWTWQSILSDSLVAEASNATFNTPTMDINAPAYITTNEYNRYVPYDSPKVQINDKSILTLGYNSLDCYDALRLKIQSNCNADYDYNIPEIRFKYEI